MARIRNIKPEFFSHEELQDMEVEHPELHPMLVFSALWTQCEWSGVFHWSIRKLKLAILPFLEYDLENALCYLEQHGFIKRFVRDDKEYGYVYNFVKYQAISGKEKEQGLKYPAPTVEELSWNETGTIPEQNRVSRLRHRTSTKDIDVNFPKNQSSKKINLLDREPKNDLERINKKWLENYIAIFGNPPINPRWDLSSSLVSRALKHAGLEKVLQALETARQDTFCLESGYILKIIMSGNVLSRLINAGTGPPQSRLPPDRKCLGGLEL
jgi:hypothetical protein